MGDETEAIIGKKGSMIPVFAVAITIVLNIGTGVWFASGIEQRMRHVEDKQLDFAHDVGRLDQAREQTNLHMKDLDDHYKNLDDKVSAILGIVEQWDQSGPPAPDQGGVETHTAPPQNFQKPPGRR